MRVKHLNTSVAWALVAALSCGVGAIALAQDEQPNGRIVRIGPSDDGQQLPSLPAPNNNRNADTTRDAQPAAPSFWIGVVGGPITPELRAHIDLPADQGLLVREIAPNSPAANSGLKQYDILLRANDTPLRDMRDLVDLVRTQGEKQGQVTLEVLRKGQRQSVPVKPVDRPANVAQSLPNGEESDAFQRQGGQVPMLGQVPELRRFFEGLGNDGAPLEFRQFGPGVIVGGNAGGGAAMPNGVSISVQKQNGQPAHATVKQGDKTWEVTEGDAESLKQLPDDLRPAVERMLNGSRGNNGFGMNWGGPAMPRMNAPGVDEPALRERMDRLERQIQRLIDQQSRGANAPASESK